MVGEQRIDPPQHQVPMRSREQVRVAIYDLRVGVGLSASPPDDPSEFQLLLGGRRHRPLFSS